MSLRLPLIAAAALAVAACNPTPRREAAAQPPPAAPVQPIVVQAGCCCQQQVCPPQQVAPTRVRYAKKPARKHHRVRHHADRGELYGGRYAVAVSVEERETYSERYLGPVEEYGHGYRDDRDGYGHGGRYREGYRRGYDYGDYDRRRPPPPQARPYDYPLAGRDREGYLQWPAKVGY